MKKTAKPMFLATLVGALASLGAVPPIYAADSPTLRSGAASKKPFRYGLQTIVIPTAAGYGLDTTEWLMPQCLNEAGYKTAIIGKWHLGHADKKYWPKQRGFDYQYGAVIGELDYFTHDEHGVLDWFRTRVPISSPSPPRATGSWTSGRVKFPPGSASVPATPAKRM